MSAHDKRGKFWDDLGMGRDMGTNRLPKGYSPEARLLRDRFNAVAGDSPDDVMFTPDSSRMTAAYYWKTQQVIQVEWADRGNPYNYYGVPPGIWRDFKRAESKGRYITRVLDRHNYGVAD